MIDTPEIEKVARALAPSSWAALGLADTLAHKSRRTASLRHARAALEALREPSAAMTWAANDAFPEAPAETTCRQIGETIWRAMMATALGNYPSDPSKWSLLVSTGEVSIHPPRVSSPSLRGGREVKISGRCLRPALSCCARSRKSVSALRASIAYRKEQASELAALHRRITEIEEALKAAYDHLSETNECNLNEGAAQNFLGLMHKIEVVLS